MKLRVTRVAISDLRRHYRHVAQFDPSAARELVVRIEAAFGRLLQFPDSGRPGRVDGTRELVVSRTPFVAPYRVRGDVITILAVLDGRQNWPSSF